MAPLSPCLFKLGIFQKNFALSLDTEVFYPCLQVTSYKTLRSFQMLLELLLQSLQLSRLMFCIFGNFQFPFSLGSRGIPELGLLLEAESHPGHSFHNLKICRLFQRG